MGKINRKLKTKAKKAIAAVSGLKKKDSNDYLSLEKDALLHKTKPERKIITKKEKIQQKHKELMNKFKNAAKQRKEAAAQKNREKTAVTGDLKPLKDALPSLNELFELSKDREKVRTGVQQYDEEPVKLSAKKKLRKKKEQFVKKVKAYENLLKDPDFKKNPRAVIAYHVKYTNGLIDK